MDNRSSSTVKYVSKEATNLQIYQNYSNRIAEASDELNRLIRARVHWVRGAAEFKNGQVVEIRLANNGEKTSERYKVIRATRYMPEFDTFEYLVVKLKESGKPYKQGMYKRHITEPHMVLVDEYGDEEI